MSDPLKRHVDANRSEFEVFPFDEEAAWDEIASKIQPIKTKSQRLKPWLYVAASVLLVAMFGVSVIQPNQVETAYSSEIMEAKNYYQQMVDGKISLVKSLVDDEELFADLEAMDVAFEELEKDLKDDVDNEEVVAAMIDNYRLKLKILEKILEELDQDEHEQVEPTNL
ncbi:MAG: hypothetical protein R8G66_33005 [Cytophagales bacterium]|nr:hypothetical protein [Cytophagales bacterium]